MKLRLQFTINGQYTGKYTGSIGNSNDYNSYMKRLGDRAQHMFTQHIVHDFYSWIVLDKLTSNGRRYLDPKNGLDAWQIKNPRVHRLTE
jgi:hypothetical protein